MTPEEAPRMVRPMRQSETTSLEGVLRRGDAAAARGVKETVR